MRLIADVAMKGDRLVVLDLAFVEVANAIWKRLHRGMASLEESLDFLSDLRLCPVYVEAADALLESALEIAAKHDRAVYDALFVALCQHLDLPGITADEPLFNAVHADFPRITLLRYW